MIKLFISQPMKGKTDEEIKAVRQKALYEVQAILGEDVELIDSFFEKAPVTANPLWYLSKSIELLSKADVVYFAPGWDKARGCKIENQCAREYGINVIENSLLENVRKKEKTVTRDEYREIAATVISDEVDNPNLTGANKLLVPLLGSVFVSKVEEALFGEEE